MAKQKSRKSLVKPLLMVLAGAIIASGIIAVIFTSKTNQATPITYTSTVEKLTFKYPSSWKAVKSEFPLPIDSLKTDALTLISPSGKIKISWVGAITGLGGGCDPTTTIGLNNTGCGLLQQIEADKIPNTNLFFEEYIYTKDGVNYTPRFALSSINKSSPVRTLLNVFTFQGKNNTLKSSDGSNFGPFEAVFAGGDVFQQKDTSLPYLSKEDAIKFFVDSEMLQAKQIFLSVSY